MYNHNSVVKITCLTTLGNYVFQKNTTVAMELSCTQGYMDIPCALWWYLSNTHALWYQYL